MTIPKAICICLPENESGRIRAEAHFKEIGLGVEFFWGIHAGTAGLSTKYPYEVDAPGSGYRMGSKSVGCWLSHYMLWNAILQRQDDHILILEDDAVFDKDWSTILESVMKSIPSNFDILNLGPCCMQDHPKDQIGEWLYATKQAFCTHAYIIRRDCIPFLLKTARKCWAPIDCQLVLECYPHLNTYAVYPRIVDQLNTLLKP